VAEHHPVIEIGTALIGVQVGTADVLGGDPDDGVEGLLDLGSATSSTERLRDPWNTTAFIGAFSWH
jgi:hypothetical protein